MNLAKKSLFVLVFVAAAALAGSAQEINARFTLQNPTIFGSVVLPAGTYKVQTVSHVTSVALIAPTAGAGTSVLLVPRVKEYNTACAQTSLHIVREDGEWKATSICVAESSTTLSFGDGPKRTSVTTAALAASK